MNSDAADCVQPAIRAEVLGPRTAGYGRRARAARTMTAAASRPATDRAPSQPAVLDIAAADAAARPVAEMRDPAARDR